MTFKNSYQNTFCFLDEAAIMF